jgi:hypothetical protein
MAVLLEAFIIGVPTRNALQAKRLPKMSAQHSPILEKKRIPEVIHPRNLSSATLTFGHNDFLRVHRRRREIDDSFMMRGRPLVR